MPTLASSIEHNDSVLSMERGHLESVQELACQGSQDCRFLVKKGSSKWVVRGSMRRFKVPNRDQLMLLPPSLHDLVRPDHPVRFVIRFVSAIDKSAFYERYKDTTEGQPPFDPEMMIAIFLYANMLGVYSSRKIERLIEDDLGFRFIVGDLRPDHNTISNFRLKHSKEMAGLFRESVRMALRAELVSLNHIAIDGTKIAANASAAKRKTAQALEAEIQALENQPETYLQRAEEEDEAETREHGNTNPYLLPKELQTNDALDTFIKNELKRDKNDDHHDKHGGGGSSLNRETKASKKLRFKLEKLKKAKQLLEEKERARKAQDPTGKRERDAQRKRGGIPHTPQINVTDPESRKMLMRGGTCTEGFNGQIAVDADCGIIVAADLVQDENDLRQLSPLVNEVKKNTGFYPSHVSADTGYFNCEQMEELSAVEFFIPPRKRSPNESHLTRAEKMREKLETERGRTIYNLRKTIVEPVFGIFKHARKYKQALCRGRMMVNAEWQLLCTAHNILRMIKLSTDPA